MPYTSTKRSPRLTSLTLGLLAMLFISPVQATEKRWYQAEVMIIERLANVHSEEQHPTSLASKVRTSKELQAYPSIGSQAYTRLPKEFRQLNHTAKKLQRSGHFNVLFHEAWPMPLKKQKSATWININVGTKQAGRSQLEGAIGVSLGRFLHLHTQLHLNQFAKGDTTPTTELSSLLNYPTAKAKITQRYSMVQKRKMRSVELHYLDHPKLALLVRFDPYNPQAPLPKPSEAPGNSPTKITSDNIDEVILSALVEAEVMLVEEEIMALEEELDTQ